MRKNTISLQQGIINKINAKQPFEFHQDGGQFIGGARTLLHRSHNPSQKYDNIYSDVYKYSKEENAILIGISSPKGAYEVLLYQLNK